MARKTTKTPVNKFMTVAEFKKALGHTEDSPLDIKKTKRGKIIGILEGQIFKAQASLDLKKPVMVLIENNDLVDGSCIITVDNTMEHIGTL